MGGNAVRISSKSVKCLVEQSTTKLAGILEKKQGFGSDSRHPQFYLGCSWWLMA